MSNSSVPKIESDAAADRLLSPKEAEAQVRAEREEVRRFELSEEETSGVLSELLARLDSYALECAVHFKDLAAGCGLSNDELEILRFVHKLNPALKYLLDKLANILPARYPNAVGNPGDDLEYLNWELLQRGFLVGVITGAKFSGATPKQLKCLCRHAASEMGK